MKRTRGVVIGKFFPPHAGHKYLIDTAQSYVDDLTVLVCDGAGQDPPATLRARWLQEIHLRADVRVVPDELPADDSRLWAEATIGWLGGAPDMVFTSEEYGERYAAFMGCTHMLVDQARRLFPVSGTAVRASPLAQWDYLEPCVRAHYVKRVCVVGAESTGTTTMAKALSLHYKTVWVPEYGRDYSDRKRFNYVPEWTSSEFFHIATEQCRLEDHLARQANRVLICDTDAFTTSIWHQRYIGSRSPAVEALAATRHYDLYLLTDVVGVGFEQDGTRDGEHVRPWMHNVFAEELARTGRRYSLLTGPHEVRMEIAIRRIDTLLGG